MPVWKKEQEQQFGYWVAGVGFECMLGRMGLRLSEDFGCSRTGWGRVGNAHDGLLERRNERYVLEAELRLLLRGLTYYLGYCRVAT